MLFIGNNDKKKSSEMFDKVRSVNNLSTLIQEIYIRKMNNEKVEIEISDPEFRNTEC